MDENRVKKIFLSYLANYELDDALAAAYKQISEEMLADIFSRKKIEKERRELILKINESFIRLGYFLDRSITITSADPKLFEHLGFLYIVWEKVLNYLYNNYETLPEELKKLDSKDEILNAAQVVAGYMAKDTYQFQSTGSITFRKHKSAIIKQWFQMVLQDILMRGGAFDRFMKELNKAALWLELYQAEIESKKNTKVH